MAQLVGIGAGADDGHAAGVEKSVEGVLHWSFSFGLSFSRWPRNALDDETSASLLTNERIQFANQPGAMVAIY
jgi:hypothetical protein